MTTEAGGPSAHERPGVTAGGATPGVAARLSDWRLLVAVFWVTSMVEGLGVSQIFAFLPKYLSTMDVAPPDVPRFVGVFTSLIFVVGAPLVPLWGVWADKYSRKAVIVRSAVVEAVVFAGVALSREPWQLALSVMLVGLQLGNTGVMLAAIRDVTPRRRLGTVIGLFGASSPIGFAVGPALGGIIVDGLGFGLPVVFWTSSALSVATALLVAFGSREVRPEVIPQGSTIGLAFGAMRGVLADPAVRRIFAVFGTAFLANQLSRPFVPILVAGIHGDLKLVTSIALVAGTAALVGALISPLGGLLGDRIGFRPVLVGALIGAGIAVGVQPLMPSVPTLALAVLVFGACSAVVSTMVFGLLATEIAPERRSTTLNLVYLPLYAAGILGPALGSVVVGVGTWAPFATGALVSVIGGIVLGFRLLRGPRALPPDRAPQPDRAALPERPDPPSPAGAGDRGGG
jgi:MFS family permease